MIIIGWMVMRADARDVAMIRVIPPAVRIWLVCGCGRDGDIPDLALVAVRIQSNA